MATSRVITRLLLPSLLLAAACSARAEPLAKAKAASKPRVWVTISKDTTRITAPLRKDGYPDYLAAMNERLSRGVTPENNAAVLFWKAIGPTIGENNRDRYFRMLGMAVPPEKGDYFVTSEEHLERRKRTLPLDKQLSDDSDSLMWQRGSLATKPWSKEEYRVWADWLKLNEEPLALLVEASKRPRRYDPVICGKDSPDMLFTALQPALNKYRDVVHALAARAMLQLHDSKPEAAWQDLLACQRLGRLVGQGMTLNEYSFAITTDDLARKAEQVLLEDPKLSAIPLAAMRRELARLPPVPDVADVFGSTERWTFLDAVTLLAREGRSSGMLWAGKNSKNFIDTINDSIANYALGATVDWDSILRQGNARFDQMVEAQRKPTCAARTKARAAFPDTPKKSAPTPDNPKAFARALSKDPRKAMTEWIGQELTGLLVPSGYAFFVADTAAMQSELTDLAFALAVYRAERGSYPAKLADLAPRYVVRLPKDIFANDQDLHYSLHPGGYLLYSVGRNGKDDGGKNYFEDPRLGGNEDDLAVRVPFVPSE